MGLYLNPRTESKEAFLAREGTRIPDEAVSWPAPAGYTLVCLVDNGGFSAAGIADSSKEITRFQRGMSGRWHQWYLVPSHLVREANGF